jgi:hypothetical protein
MKIPIPYSVRAIKIKKMQQISQTSTAVSVGAVKN